MKRLSFKSLLILMLMVISLVLSFPKNAHASLLDTISNELDSCISGGCDPGKIIKDEIRRTVSAAAGGVADPAREAFISAMDEVFDENIFPLVDRLDILAQSAISKTGGEAKEVIFQSVEKIISEIDPLLERGISIANQFSPTEIRDNTNFT